MFKYFIDLSKNMNGVLFTGIQYYDNKYSNETFTKQIYKVFRSIFIEKFQISCFVCRWTVKQQHEFINNILGFRLKYFPESTV